MQSYLAAINNARKKLFIMRFICSQEFLVQYWLLTVISVNQIQSLDREIFIYFWDLVYITTACDFYAFARVFL